MSGFWIEATKESYKINEPCMLKVRVVPNGKQAEPETSYKVSYHAVIRSDVLIVDGVAMRRFPDDSKVGFFAEKN